MPCKEDTRRDIVVSIIHSTHACKLIYDNEIGVNNQNTKNNTSLHLYIHGIMLFFCTK